MASVYGNAHVTFMAVKAASSEEGFLGSRISSFIIKEERDLSDKKSSLYLINCDFYFNSMARATDRRGNPLFKRAWVVQERILSRRKLMFCNDQVFWECNQLKTSEDKQIFQGTQEQRVSNLTEWFGAVETFMACSITYERDVFPAMAGIAKSIAQDTGFTYCAGIWVDTFPTCLLWYPERYTKKVRRKSYVAPTFSWAGSNGPVWYRSNATRSTFTRFCKYITHVQKLRDGNNDPYSAISAAAIVLEGPALMVTCLYQTDYGVNLVVRLQNGQRYVMPAQFDHEDADYKADGMVVLPLYDDESRMQAVVLQRAGNERSNKKELSGNGFHRIGISWCSFSDLSKMNSLGNIVEMTYSEKEKELRRFAKQAQTQKETVTLL